MRRRIGAAIALVSLACLSDLALGVPVAQREFDWVLKRTPDVANGAELYETCAACHGNGGEGAADGSVPALAGQHFTVVAKQLVDFRSGVRRDPRMEHFSDTRHLAYSQYVADVAAYISSLPRPTSRRMFSADVMGRGAVVYTQACERCHGAAGEGKEDQLAPRMASQHFEYLIQQLDNAVAGWRPAMQDTHAALLAGLSRKDIVAVASYLAGLGAVTTAN
jgi:cytochrome c553